ncbi:Gas vesicle synthesis protein GvpO [Mycolicibacterium chubuense NBB4]|uniref:Gas vesicle synthesis protein GvpO n=1 Tax=Mycolicibacterium chubuense (strain NBB4) TaxID=710421 RepID=I4BE42_MYCCN|nr:gas vesicle protein GvpO [Mycolicibacterium chubuense]AFM15549.1 Gas vesicle synthesis protein GvpO [Mycolicibacterium chubuense NBB4]
MAQRTRPRSAPDPEPGEPLTAREAVALVREYATEMAGSEPVRMTSATPTDDGGWIIEVEMVEDRRIPSLADILALYEVEIDFSGELLSYRRTRRFMRGQTSDGSSAL